MMVCISQEVGEPSVQLRLKVRDPDTGAVQPTVMSVSAAKFRVLLSGACVYVCACVWVCVWCACVRVCV